MHKQANQLYQHQFNPVNFVKIIKLVDIMMFYVSALLSVSICSDHSPSMKRDDSHTPIPYSVHFFVSFGIRNCANASICFHLINNTWSNHICRCLIMYCEVIHCHVIQFHCHILWFSLFPTRHIYVREKTLCNCWRLLAASANICFVSTEKRKTCTKQCPLPTAQLEPINIFVV